MIRDINQKVEKWLEEEKDFTCMPGRLGWFQWREKIHLYIEVLSRNKALRDHDTNVRVPSLPITFRRRNSGSERSSLASIRWATMDGKKKSINTKRTERSLLLYLITID